MANAHENIDNEILLESINRIRHTGKGNWMEGLFEAETKGGDKRYIHRAQPMYPNKEAWQFMQNNLYKQIRENPSFADTLTQKELPGTIRRMETLGEGILQRIIKKLFGE